MPFNSLSYFVFLALFVSLYWLAPQRTKVHLLVVASSLFYALWSFKFYLLLLGTEIVIFYCTKKIASAQGTSRKRWLLASLAVNLGLLFFFKYAYLGYDGLRECLSLLGVALPSSDSWGFTIILPLGISFHTFHSISYTVDIYRKVQKPIADFATFYAFIIFWPQLIAGPILRCGEVAPQFHRHHHFDVADMTYGLTRILQGLFKKVVIADNLAPYVEYWFDKPGAHLTGIDVWVAAFLFGYQIYFDFSGYSDIALGSARLLGIKFPENFNWPYLSSSPKEFWKRWHISLSSWIRDYLYLPLTGQHFQRKSEGGLGLAASQDMSGPGRGFALFATWALMGLWHGAAWTFVLWGVYHGMVVQLYRSVRFFANLAERSPVAAKAVMLLLAMFGWIPFRAHSLEQTFQLWRLALDPFTFVISPEVLRLSSNTAFFSYFFAFALTLALPAAYAVQHATPNWLHARPVAFLRHFALTAAMVFLIVLYLNTKQQFIYFQF